MAFFILSDYVCVESGSLLAEGEDRFAYPSKEAALAEYESRRESLLRSVGSEIQTIRDNEHLEFLSPYVVWILLLNLEDCDATPEAFDAYLIACVERRRRPESFLKKQAERYDGWVFSDQGRKEHPLGEVIDELVERYS